VMAGVGGAALITAGVLFFAGGPSDARASLVPTPQGFAVVGAFP